MVLWEEIQNLIVPKNHLVHYFCAIRLNFQKIFNNGQRDGASRG